MKKVLILFSIALILYSCQKPQPRIIETDLIEVIAYNDTDEEMSKWLEPYKKTVDDAMNNPIGISDTTMIPTIPESLLGNLITKIVKKYVQENGKQYDCVVINIGSLRDSLPKGEITLRNIYQIYPFDNEIILIKISGKEMYKLCHIIAKQGGQVTSGIEMNVTDGIVTNIKVNKNPIDTTRNYNIITTDYLSFGNDYLSPLSKYTDIYYFKKCIRDMIIDYIQKETREKRIITSTINNEIIIQ